MKEMNIENSSSGALQTSKQNKNKIKKFMKMSQNKTTIEKSHNEDNLSKMRMPTKKKKYK